MATPTITNYTVTESGMPTSSSGGTYYSMCMRGSTLWYWYNIDKTLRMMDGTGTITSLGNSTGTATIGSMGLTPDGAYIYMFRALAATSYTGSYWKVNALTGALVTTYTYVSGNQAGNFIGSCYVADANTVYACDNGGTTSGPMKITFTDTGVGTGTYSISNAYGNLSAFGYYGCQLYGSDNLFFIQNNAGTTTLYSVKISDGPGGAATALTGGPIVNSAQDLLVVNAFAANSTTYDFLFVGVNSGSSSGISQYSILSSTSVSSIVGSKTSSNFDNLKCIAYSDSLGSTTGNLRLFTSSFGSAGSGNAQITKWFNGNSPGTTGPQSNPANTGSLGGDPHILTFKGEDILILRLEPFEYLDTHPLTFLNDDDIQTYVVCECFSLKNDYDNFGKSQLSEKQYSEVITNLDDSYLKFVTIRVGIREYTFNMLSLLIEGENGNGSEINDPHFFASEVSRFEPENCDKARCKYVQRSCTAIRKVTVTGGRYVLDFEITRSNCIHVCDLDLLVSGERDPLSFGGAISTGIVEDPLIF